MERLIVHIRSAVTRLALRIGRHLDWGRERDVLVHDLLKARQREETLEKEAAVLSERTRLAEEMHDTIAQDLSGLRFLVEQARRQTAASAGLSGTAAQEAHKATLATLDAMDQAVSTVLTQARCWLATTNPVSLESSLKDAFGRITARFAQETGVTADLDIADIKLPRETEVVFVRCLQEGLSNVQRHAQASRVWVRVGIEGDEAQLTLTDDGVGFETAMPSDTGFGLPGMRTRVQFAGGTFAITSPGPGHGTSLAVRMPARAGTTPDPDTPEQMEVA